MTITYTGVDPEHHVGWGNSKILKIAYFSFVLAHAPQNFVFNRYFCAISSFWEKKFPTFLALDHLMRTELCYYVLYLDVYWIHKGFELYLAFAPRTIQYFPCVYSFRPVIIQYPCWTVDYYISSTNYHYQISNCNGHSSEEAQYCWRYDNNLKFRKSHYEWWNDYCTFVMSFCNQLKLLLIYSIRQVLRSKLSHINFLNFRKPEVSFHVRIWKK